MSASFEWSRVNTVGPVFDLDKLGWLNGHYIRSLSAAELAERIVAYIGVDGARADLVRRATPLVQERMQVLREAREMLGFLLTDDIVVEEAAAAKFLGPEQRPVIEAAVGALASLGEQDWRAASIEEALRAALV